MDVKWSAQTRIFVITILLIISVVLIYLFREVVRPLVVAALLVLMLYPIATYIRRKTRLSQKAAANLVFFILIALVATIPAVGTPALISEANALGDQISGIIDGANDFLEHTTVFGYRILSGVPQGLEESITETLKPEVVYEWIAAITENLVWIGVILIVVYYLMVDWPRAKRAMFDVLPDALKRDGYELYKRIREIWGLYLRGQISTMFILGLTAGVMAALLGLPAAILLGLLAAVFGLLPSIGSSVFAAIAGFIALISRSTLFGLPKFWYVVIVVAVFLGVHLFENYWLRPRVLGEGLKLHPAVILVSVLGAIMVGGGLLALVIVPMISSADVFLRYLARKLSEDDPWAEELEGPTLEEIIGEK